MSSLFRNKLITHEFSVQEQVDNTRVLCSDHLLFFVKIVLLLLTISLYMLYVLLLLGIQSSQK